VFGDGLQADRERLGELVHRRLAVRQPREDRPAGRIGQRGEHHAQLVHHSTFYSTNRFINR
jgi:hypothetical protein